MSEVEIFANFANNSYPDVDSSKLMSVFIKSSKIFSEIDGQLN